jgi:hypothetical protein
MGVASVPMWYDIPYSSLVEQGCIKVSDHRGSNSQAIDFESVKTYPIFTAKNESHGKSNT